MSVAYRSRDLTGDELAALEDQRDFLLRSLDDLEEEHAAGDVEDDDYEVLRQDYTARAAGVIRTIEARRTQVVSPRRRARRQLFVAVAGVVLFAIGAGLLVAQAAGRRSASGQVTGDIRTTTRNQLDEAVALAADGRYDDAIAAYNDILETQPNHVEALSYKGWVQVLSGDIDDGIVALTAASRIDPDYADAHAFLAVAFWRLGNTDTDQADYFIDLALRALNRLEALDPPPYLSDLVAPLRTAIERRHS